MPPKRRMSKHRELTFREKSELMIGPPKLWDMDTGEVYRVMEHLSQFACDADRREAWQLHRDEIIAQSRGKAPWAQTAYEGR